MLYGPTKLGACWTQARLFGKASDARLGGRFKDDLGGK